MSSAARSAPVGTTGALAAGARRRLGSRFGEALDGLRLRERGLDLRAESLEHGEAVARDAIELRVARALGARPHRSLHGVPTRVAAR